MHCWLVLAKHQSPFLESCFVSRLFGVHEISGPNKVRLVKKSNKVAGFLYEWAAATEEIKASLVGSGHLFSFYPEYYLVSCLTTSKLLAVTF